MDFGYTERDSATTDRLKPGNIGTDPITYETFLRRVDRELGGRQDEQSSFRAALIAFAAKLAAEEHTRLIEFETAFLAHDGRAK